MTITQEKKTRRLAMIEQLKQIENKYEKENQIIKSLMAHPKFKAAESIGITLSMDHELDTRFLIRYAQLLDKKVFVPCCDYKTKVMSFVKYTRPSDLVKDSYGIDVMQHHIEEGTSPELIIVPGVIFNEQGYRTGYGGGYYDKYLSAYNGNTISLAFDIQLDEVLVESHDIPVQTIITEKRIIEVHE